MSLLSALYLLASVALAAPAEPQPGGARVYGALRGTLAVPTGYAGLATSYGAEVGALFRDGHQVGLRLAYVPSPPDVYGPRGTPDHAAGPVATWAYNVRVAPRFDIAPTVGVGAMFGPSPETQVNVVLPYIQAGLSMRGRIPTSNGGAVALGPEIGFVPTILAPYVAINVALIGPKPTPIAPDEM